jgi:hypothetical protein
MKVTMQVAAGIVLAVVLVVLAATLLVKVSSPLGATLGTGTHFTSTSSP